jgi:4-amino-4-deoxy-L-arabinose transferase-like glycosyltransferase
MSSISPDLARDVTAVAHSKSAPQTKPRQSVNWSGALLVVLVILGLFTDLGGRGLNEPDEGRYAEIAREMLASGNWIEPTLHGFEHFQKPPLIYWATAASFQLFGLTEWAARLPSALAAGLTLELTFFIARTWFGSRAAFASTLVLLTSLEFFALARSLTPDMLMTFFITAALASFVHWTIAPDRWCRLWGFFLAMGLGFLTKGPMALVVPLSGAVAWQLAMRHCGEPRRIPWFKGLSMTLFVGLSWHLVICLRHPHLAEYFLKSELAGRVATNVHGRHQPFWFFVPVILAGWLPGVLFLPSIAVWCYQRLRAPERLSPVGWMLIGWLSIPLLVLSLSSSKLVTYVLPLFPALALLGGGWWSRSTVAHNVVRPAMGWLLILGLLAAGSWLGGHFWPPLASLRTPTLIGGLLLVAVALGVAVYEYGKVPPLLGGTLVLTTLGAWLILAGHADRANNLLNRQACVRTLAAHIRSIDAANPVVFTYGVNAPGLEFYLRRTLPLMKTQADDFIPHSPGLTARLLAMPEDTASLRQPGQPLLGLVRSDRLATEFPEDEWAVVDRAGGLALVRLRETAPNGLGIVAPAPTKPGCPVPAGKPELDPW